MEQHNISNISVSSLEYQLSSAVFGFCFLLGLPGNIVVVVVILRHFKRENFTLHLMLNLAVSDILCLLTAPLLICNMLFGWYIGQALCKTLFFLIYLSVYVSSLTITLISVHRYVFVLHPSKWAKLGQKGERALLLIFWATACIPCGLLTCTHDVIWDGSREFCWRINLSDKSRVAILLSEIVFTFIIPFFIIVVSYCCLHKKVNQTAFFSDPRLTRLITSIVVTFLILWTPCHIVSILELSAISIQSQNTVLYDILMAIKGVSRPVAKSIVFINSCVNPLLYAFSYRSLRQTAESKRVSSATHPRSFSEQL